MDKVWIQNYQEGVPEVIDPDAIPSLVHMIEDCFSRFKDNVAYENMGATLTYDEVDEKSKAFAAFLQKRLNLKKGDRFAVMLPNLLQYPVALFGLLRAGLTVVNTNPLYTAQEITHQLNDSGAKGILVLANFARTLEEALPKLKTLQHVVITELGDMFSFPKRQIVNLVVKHVKKMVPSYRIQNKIHFLDALKEGESEPFDPVTVSGQDIAFLQYTGGTTGVAKGAILTHRNMVANVMQASSWVKPLFNECEEIIITALPLYHIFSLTANCLTFLNSGAKNILITNPRDIPNFIKEIGNSQFTAITGVNTLFNALLNDPEFKNVDFSKLKYTLSGGMALQPNVAKRWQEVTGRPILEAFGLTETSPAVTMNPSNTAAFNGSIGLPVPSTEVKVVDDNGNELPIGEAGELCVRGPQVMQGYWHRPIETANVLSPDGWLKTGDIARMDENGFVYIVDRKKDMIIVSGFNVYPNEVEGIIADIPGVLEVGVVGVMHDKTGEMVKACVVKNEDSLTENDIIEHCRKYLTAYKVPKAVEFCDELPKTNVGKILRRALREKQQVDAVLA